jgi:hypothetical protein
MIAVFCPIVGAQSVDSLVPDPTECSLRRTGNEVVFRGTECVKPRPLPAPGLRGNPGVTWISVPNKEFYARYRFCALAQIYDRPPFAILPDDNDKGKYGGIECGVTFGKESVFFRAEGTQCGFNCLFK